MKNLFFTGIAIGIPLVIFSAILYMFFRGLYTVLSDIWLTRELKQLAREARQRRATREPEEPVKPLEPEVDLRAGLSDAPISDTFEIAEYIQLPQQESAAPRPQ